MAHTTRHKSLRLVWFRVEPSAGTQRVECKEGATRALTTSVLTKVLFLGKTVLTEVFSFRTMLVEPRAGHGGGYEDYFAPQARMSRGVIRSGFHPPSIQVHYNLATEVTTQLALTSNSETCGATETTLHRKRGCRVE